MSTASRMTPEEDKYRQALEAVEHQDFAAALNLLREAGGSGHPEAQYRLGVLYANAEGVPLDYVAAATWLRRAADQGHGRAQSILA
jgi:TPR repeat protein